LDAEPAVRTVATTSNSECGLIENNIINNNVQRIWHSEDRASWYIRTIKANKMHISQLYFGKEFYVFRTDLLSIIRSLNTVFTAEGICHTSYVDCR
jgi:hypothetical protein